MAPPFVGNVIHDPAVAADGNVVIDLKLEPVELLVAGQITRVMRIDARDRAIDQLPAGTDSFLLERVPAVHALAVEQKLPSGGFLRIG